MTSLQNPQRDTYHHRNEEAEQNATVNAGVVIHGSPPSHGLAITEIVTPASENAAPLVDLSKLDIRSGVIHYKIRQQDGSFVPMTVKDTLHWRRFVAWVQVHD